jgi:hypothetical protein
VVCPGFVAREVSGQVDLQEWGFARTGAHSRRDTPDAFHGRSRPLGAVGVESDGGGRVAYSAAGVIATAKRDLQAWRIVAWRLRCAGLRVAEIERMLGLYCDLYRGFTVKHFHERLGKRHGYTLGYTVTKRHLHRAGLVQAATKRSAHRKKRPRRRIIAKRSAGGKHAKGVPDASTHAWLAGDAGRCDLVVTMDDATSAIYSMFLVGEEARCRTCATCVRWWRSMPCSVHVILIRGSHYFVTPEAGGRSEPAFSTLQHRLPKELKLAGISTIEAANRWLSEPYMAAHNKQFAIDARAGRFSVRRRCDGGLAGDPVRSGGTDGGQRQHGEAAAAEPATAAEPAARTLRQGDGAGCMSIRTAGWRFIGDRNRWPTGAGGILVPPAPGLVAGAVVGHAG